MLNKLNVYNVRSNASVLSFSARNIIEASACVNDFRR